MLKNRHIAGALLFAGGCAYCWNLIPDQYRPSITHSPVHKSPQTITVDVASPTDLAISTTNHSFRVACDVPDMLHPVEGRPSEVHVLFRYAGSIVGDATMPCPKK